MNEERNETIRMATRERLEYLMGAIGLSGGYLYSTPNGDHYVIGTLPSGEPLGDGRAVSPEELRRVAMAMLDTFGPDDEELGVPALELLERIGYAEAPRARRKAT
jgi:hypothetical protein